MPRLMGLLSAGALLSACIGFSAPAVVPAPEEEVKLEPQLAQYRAFAAKVYRYAAAQRGTFVVAPLPAWAATWHLGIGHTLWGSARSDPLFSAKTFAPLGVRALWLQSEYFSHASGWQWGWSRKSYPLTYKPAPWNDCAQVRPDILRWLGSEATDSPWAMAVPDFGCSELDAAIVSALDVGCDWSGKEAPRVHVVRLEAGRVLELEPPDCDLSLWIAQPDAGAAKLTLLEAEMTEVDLSSRRAGMISTPEEPPQLTTRIMTLISVWPLVKETSWLSDRPEHERVGEAWTAGDLTINPEGFSLRSSGLLVRAKNHRGEDSVGPAERPSTGEMLVIWHRALGIPLAIARFAASNAAQP